MAVVATPFSLTQMNMMLMDSPRIQLPRLPAFDADGRRKELREDPGFNAPPVPRVKRRRTLGQPKTPASRNRKKVFSYETEKDMETYEGHVRLPSDAIVLFEACRVGLLPRVQRRLSEKERQSIKSGSVFVWDEREAGMRRWTDGKSWSASRVSGSFLTYREMEGKRGGGQSNVFPPPPPPVPGRTNGGRTPESGGGGNTSDMDLQQDEGPDGYRYKPDGLMKQSFSITTSTNQHLHLISYYSRSSAATQQLLTPTTDPSLKHIRPAKGMYPESTVHEHQNIPAVTRSPMASGAPYSTVPQMAGYARHGPPSWSSQPNGHGWQQPHMAPQYPQQGYGYQYPPQNGGYYQDGAPPPTHAQSPLQYSQSASHPAQPSPAPQTPYDDRRPPPTPQSSHPVDPNLATYDSRRQPLTPEDRQGPPPLQHPQERVYGYASLENPHREPPPREPYDQPPQYDSRRYPPQPNVPQDRRPPSSHHSQPPTPNRSGYPPQHQQQQHYNYPPQGPPAHYGQPQSSPQQAQHPPYSHRPQPAPPHHYQQPPPQHSYPPQPAPPPPPPPPPQTPSQRSSSYQGPHPPNLQIDPALTSRPSPHPPQQNHSNTHSQNSTPNPQKTDSAGNATPYEARGMSQASTIPSIGALMNGSSIEQNGHSPSTNSNSNGHSNSNGNASGSGVATPVGTDKTGDRSPNAGKNDGPQDISTDKVGFSEDVRALKVLNKGFH